MSTTTKRPIAVILGAGASADFGIPLGGGLYDKALSYLSDFETEWKEAFEKLILPDSNRMRAYFQGSEPYQTLFDNSFHDDGSASLNRISDLRALMEKAPVYSLDTLALENPEHVKICKFLTAYCLAETINPNLFEKIEGYNEPKEWDFLKRKINTNTTEGHIDNWLHLFVSMMRAAKRENPDTQYNFISFNYDGIAENVMKHLWSLPSDNLGPFEDTTSFFYPHGQLKWKSDARGITRLDISDFEEAILFAHNKEHKDGFPPAIKALEESEQVFSLGFNFAPENIASLDLLKASEKKSLVYQNFDKNEGLDNRIQKLKFSSTERFSGPIAAAITRGYLGDLPS